MTKWLENSISLIPSYCLILSEKEYKEVIIELKIEYPNIYRISSSAKACVKHFESKDGTPACLVCMFDFGNMSVPEICGTLAHEAVHIYQRMIEHIGEINPGAEFMAYTIQIITTNLISDFFNRKLKKLVK